MKCPCYGCDDRSVLCHSKCSKYQEWSVNDREQKEKERKQRIYDYSENYYTPSRAGKRKFGS